jgi:hypothetical protein
VVNQQETTICSCCVRFCHNPGFAFIRKLLCDLLTDQRMHNLSSAQGTPTVLFAPTLLKSIASIPRSIYRYDQCFSPVVCQDPCRWQRALSFLSRCFAQPTQQSPLTWLAAGLAQIPSPAVSPIRTVWKILEANVCVCSYLI